jgi:hypothetical protein
MSARILQDNKTGNQSKGSKSLNTVPFGRLQLQILLD